MQHIPQSWFLVLGKLLLLMLAIDASFGPAKKEKKPLKTSVFYSPPIELTPGSVSDKFYYNISFPKGHIAVKSLSSDVVDEAGNSVPLREVYLHHWVLDKYYIHAVATNSADSNQLELQPRKSSSPGAGKTCRHGLLGQHFGLGPETRRTHSWVPDPYGIEVGNPRDIPYGHEERWFLNVHVIDTRGADDELGCAECRCGLYNVTDEAAGRRPLGGGYVGGLRCCHDGARCRLRRGFADTSRRAYYLRCTVQWKDWDDDDQSLVPVQVYIFDVTYVDGGRSGASGCKIEYDVEPCDDVPAESRQKSCVDSRKAQVVIPRGGDLIYGVAHQHPGGIGASLYGQLSARLLCSSSPIYGNGTAAGNEAGYVVGMSTCYPEPGSVRISDGEILTLESNYSSSHMHTGVMGLFYILVAAATTTSPPPGLQEASMQPKRLWIFVLCIPVAASAAVFCCHLMRRRKEYLSLSI